MVIFANFDCAFSPNFLIIFISINKLKVVNINMLESTAGKPAMDGAKKQELEDIDNQYPGFDPEPEEEKPILPQVALKQPQR